MPQAAHRAERIKYAVRDVILVAREAAAAGQEMLYLNIGDPIQYDFETPAPIVDAICKALRDGYTGYGPSEGLPAALEAIRREAARKKIDRVQDVFIGNGGSECIEVALAALVNEGEAVLTPYPGYPLYNAVLAKLGCVEQPYHLDEANGWQPDLTDIAGKIDERTRAIVLINPNNPTGSVCGKETLEGILELAARHDLVVLSDEIYDKLVFDQDHVSIASLTDEVPVLTFNGLSKAYLGPGLRVGWCISSGPPEKVRPLVDAAHKFLRARLCAVHPMQHAIPTALDGEQSHLPGVLAKLRRRRDLIVERLNGIDGISCVAPQAAFYAFPQLHGLRQSDEVFVQELIRQTGVVVVHGSGFGQRPGTSHIRVVYLPDEQVLGRALDKLEQFWSSYR